MYRTILVPYDGSALSAEALPLAIELARRTTAVVHLAMVHDPSSFIPFVAGEVAVPIYDQALEREHRAENAQRLEETAGTLRTAGIETTTVLLEGAVADTLERYAEQIAADITVMTTHGRGGFQRVRLGSVASRFLTRITHPVLLLRAAEGESAPGFPTGPVLCALDGTLFAEAMLPHARAFAAAAGVPLHLASVAVPHIMPMTPFGTEMLLLDEQTVDLETASRSDYLARVSRGCPAGTTHVTRTDMSVYRGLLEEAEARGAGAIAIATHGRSGLSRLVLGSTTDELIRHATLPVLVFRPQSAMAR